MHEYHPISVAMRLINHIHDYPLDALPPDQASLDVIQELGFVDLKRRVVLLPQYNVHTSRVEPLVRYLQAYLDAHPEWAEHVQACYFTVYDGWREHTPPAPVADRQYVRLSADELRTGFAGRGTQHEPGRFINLYPDDRSHIYPVLDYPVVAFSRHKGDPTVLLVPDSDFLPSHGNQALMNEVDAHDVPWEQKINQAIFRAGNNGIGYREYQIPQVKGRGRLYNQRECLVIQTQDDGRFNARIDDPMTKAQMLPYKYQIDVDGEVNAWTGLWWKLYSNSVVFKVDSHYEQWFYPWLKPWEHYIPVAADLSDLDERMAWAEAHDDACRQIAINGKHLVARLTYPFSVEEYRIPLPT